MKKNKKVQMLRPSHMSVDYHETESKITTKVLVDQNAVVKVSLVKSSGKYEIKILAKDGRLLEHWLFDENRQKEPLA